MKQKTIVLGGGITGLVTAYSAIKKDKDVFIYESKNRLGGMINTIQTKHGIVESAANGFILTDEIKELFQSLSLDFIKTKRESKRRFFYVNQKVKLLPVSLFELLKSLYGLYFKESTPLPNENFYHWSCRIFGETTTKRIIEPALGGIYAADLKSLDPRMIFGNLDWSQPSSFFQRFKKQRNKKSTLGLVSLKDGMGSLIQALETSLQSRAHIKLNSQAPVLEKLIKKYNSPEIHICLSLKQCEEYLKRNGYDLPEVNLLTVSTVTCFYTERLLKKTGFGLLFPKNQDIEANGVLFNSDIFEHRTFDHYSHSETWVYAGNKFDNLKEEELKKIQMNDRKMIHGRITSPLESFVTQWQDGFPVYDEKLIAFNQRLDEIEAEWNKKNTKVIFKGNYRRGIGLRSLFEMAAR